MKIRHFIDTMTHNFMHMYSWIDRKVVFPLYRKLIALLSARCEKKISRYKMTSDWKEQTLWDFKLWLSDLPQDGPPIPPSETPGCDLYTLLSEFSGLRQEIRLQNREQSKSIKSVNAFVDAYMDTFELLKKNASDLRQLHADTARSAEKKALCHFFDLRDTLVRAAEAVIKQKSAGRFWRRGKGELDTVLESCEIAIRKFDRAMSFSGITATETLGKPFNSKTMRAISVTALKRDEPAENENLVVEQACGGFSRGDEILKYAEVVVKRRES